MSDGQELTGDARAPASGALGALSAAGRALPVTLIAALPGLVFLAGFDNLAFGLGCLAGVVLAGLLIAPHIARAGAATITEALSATFGKSAAACGAVVVSIVVLPLLVADYSLVARLSEIASGMPYQGALIAALALSSVAAMLPDRAFSLLATAAYAVLLFAVAAPLALMAHKSIGGVAPEIAYGPALTAVTGLEDTLIENGLVDFETFAVHVKPFLRLSQLDMVALVVSLSLGIAVLPQLVAALAASRSAAKVRVTGAWAALFVAALLIAMPALATYAKLEIYGAIAKSTPLSNLPPWLEAPLAAGLAQIHGTSIALLDAVAEALRDGQDSAHAVAAALAPAIAKQWAVLDAATQDAVLGAARTIVAEPQTSAWTLYTSSILPVAAAAAGNQAAVLTQASLVLEPTGLLLALPELTGAPRWIGPSLLGGVVAAGIVMAAAFLRCLFAFGSPEQVSPPRTMRGGAVIVGLGLAIAAAVLAALRPEDSVTIAVSALSLGAAGLFPVLSLGLSWGRATAAGAVAAIVAGAGVTLYYDAGIQVFPAAFYKTWQGLSDAGDMAIEEFTAREEAVNAAEDAEARATALADLDDLARGTATRHGLANWAGIDSASGAIFGVPIGFAVLVLVSLLTPRRKTDQA